MKQLWVEQYRPKTIDDYVKLKTPDLYQESCTYNVHKQWVNRLLEPYMWHTVIVTATEWENFFALRCPQYSPLEDKSVKYRSWKDMQKVWHMTFLDNDKMMRFHLNKGQAEIHMMALAEAM